MSSLVLLLRLLAAVALLALMVSFFYQPLSRGLERWSRDEVMPSQEVAAAGEEPPPAAPPSFLLQVFSNPSHARVTIDGKERGTTPAVTNVTCRSGQVIKVMVELSGHRRWQRELPCLPGESAVLEVKLDH